MAKGYDKMMADKKDGDKDEKEDEAVEMPAETPVEMPLEGKMHDKDKKKEKMDEYKIQKSGNNSDQSDKSAKSPVNANVKSMGGTTSNIAKGGADEKGRPAPTAKAMMGDVENTPGKDKSSSFKKEAPKAKTADESDKSAKSPINAKAK